MNINMKMKVNMNINMKMKVNMNKNKTSNNKILEITILPLLGRSRCAFSLCVFQRSSTNLLIIYYNKI